MPAPSTSLSTLRPDLAGSLMEFDPAADRQGFIGHMVLPVMEVAKQSGVFGKIPLEQLLQTRNTARAPGTGYSRGDYKFTTDSYACEEHGAEEPVDDREAEMYAEYFDAEVVSAMRAMDAVLRNGEIRIAAACLDTSVFTGDLTSAATAAWDVAANAKPIDDVLAAKLAIWARTGVWPNAIAMTRQAFLNLRETAQVIDRIASSGAGESTLPGRVTTRQIAQAFDLDHVLIAGSAKNTANEGQAASLSTVWDSGKALVFRKAETIDIREPCLGRTFHWGDDGSTVDGRVETYREEVKRSDIVRVRHDVDEKMLYAEMGHVITGLET